MDATSSATATAHAQVSEASSAPGAPGAAVQADVARAQLRMLIGTVRDMIALKAEDDAGGGAMHGLHGKGSAAASTAAATGPASASTRETRLAALQQKYGSTREALRATLRGLHALDTAAASASTTAAPGAGAEQGGASTEEQQRMRQRHEELRKQVEDRNETIKALMDASRRLLESMCMWEAHKKQLDMQQQAALR